MTPDKLDSKARFDSFDNGEVLHNKKKNHLPAMGWNSWNAFGSGNTEALTRVMADKFIELGLKDLGYKYIVLDDGCYKEQRVDGKLSNEENKFPNGFKALGDYIHEKGLKFGMYNDIGTNLCAGAAVGTCGHEKEDAESYIEWGVDFLKVDNCYYPFDNATFSDAKNARFTFAPNIKSVKVDDKIYSVADEKGAISKEFAITGDRASIVLDPAGFSFVTGIGTYDGTGPDATPVGLRSSELILEVNCHEDKKVSICLEYATGAREGVGQWLQLAVGKEVFYDDFVRATDEAAGDGADNDTFSETNFLWSPEIKVMLKKGTNSIRIMNHRRQENTLNSYARLLKELNTIKPDNDIIYSACEWGKTQPQNWGYKVCDSWRILNDITFRVGSDGDPGVGAWIDGYTTSVTTQYNKAVIMDEFAGLDKGWNDPDMLMVGMNGLDETQNKTHMTMWAMMNSPLMLGLDLRRVEKGDTLYNIIANRDIISINQDGLGIQAKRVFSSIPSDAPDKEYIRDINRVDILAKPLTGNKFALSFINVSQEDKNDKYSVGICQLKKFFGDFIYKSDSYRVKNVWTGEESDNTTGNFEVSTLKACDNVTFIVEAHCK